MISLCQFINENQEYDFKKKQLEVILKTNPMHDDIHLGIRKVEDIKTWEECKEYYKTDDEGFSYPDNQFNKICNIRCPFVSIYSSYDIKPGVFVSTSKMMSQDYVGPSGKVFSKNVRPNEVAWINGDEGVYVGKIE